ncbi:hypothetical protein [Lactiplantibacillus argentoratensis]|uniref:hypothetical protein n=1 Tax=Lactiplantibacillus argentoratensis TaxID=271881 RepID=UPI003F5296B5
MNKQLEKLLKTIIQTSNELNRTNISQLTESLACSTDELLPDIIALEKLGMITKVANGYLITVTPLGLNHFQTKHEKFWASLWTELRVHLFYPALLSFITFWIGFWLGHVTK